MNVNEDPKGEVIIYQNDDDSVKLSVRLENETVWLTQKQLAEMFDTTQQNISQHIDGILKDGELIDLATHKKFLLVQTEGNRQVKREIDHYNLDMIISLGYRVNSIVATKFRIWATERLKEYVVKGFTMDDERMKNAGGGGYWYELLDRIRDIRSSEKVLYRQVLDLFATSVDYDPKLAVSIEFFKIVQNKLHYAVHGHTASEIIFERADSDKPFMGLTVFKGKQPTQKDVTVAKNYLNEDELKILNNMVSGYFDFAEIQAMKRKPMYMEDYIRQLDNILTSTGEKLLTNAGRISHEQAVKKAIREYRKYQVKTISPVEQDYLDTIKKAQKKIGKTAKKPTKK